MKILIKGAGDLATGIASRLYHCGYRILMTEIPVPLTVRRSVALSRAVYEGEAVVEDMRGILVHDQSEADAAWKAGCIAVIVDEKAEIRETYQPDVIIDAILAKHNIGTCITDAPLVIGVGPGFYAGQDCHCVVETKRGHYLGRVIWDGSAIPNTGVPGNVGGFTGERLIKASEEGAMEPNVSIGSVVKEGGLVARTGGKPVYANMSGVVRGILQPNVCVTQGMKIGDIDARCEEVYCQTISDKARAIGGGVLEAVVQFEKVGRPVLSQEDENGVYAVVVLASGSSSRFGSNKLLAEVQGKPLYAHVLNKLVNCPVASKVIVTGYEEISKRAKEQGIEVVKNESPEKGISHSVKLGLQHCVGEYPNLTGILFSVCDQPEISSETFGKLLRKARENPGKIICAGAHGEPGNPVVWDRCYFAELMGLRGDVGGRQILKEHPEQVIVLETANEELKDIDFKADLTAREQ